MIPTTLAKFIRIETMTVLVFTAGLAGYAMRSSAPVAEPARLATIDLEKTYNSLQAYSQTQTILKGVADDLEIKVKAAETAVKDLEAELESFQNGSEAQVTAITKLQVAVGELRAMQQFANAKLEVERARALRDTYVAIKDAAKTLAQRDGYDYILLNDSLPEMDPASALKTMQQISARRFIFADPKADVTDALVAMMNDQFKAPTPSPVNAEKTGGASTGG